MNASRTLAKTVLPVPTKSIRFYVLAKLGSTACSARQTSMNARHSLVKTVDSVSTKFQNSTVFALQVSTERFVKLISIIVLV